MIFIVMFLLVFNPFVSTVGAGPPFTELAMLRRHVSTVVSMERLLCFLMDAVLQAEGYSNGCSLQPHQMSLNTSHWNFKSQRSNTKYVFYFTHN